MRSVWRAFTVKPSSLLRVGMPVTRETARPMRARIDPQPKSYSHFTGDTVARKLECGGPGHLEPQGSAFLALKS